MLPSTSHTSVPTPTTQMLDPDNHERERLMERMRKNEGETGGQTQIYLFTAVFCENKLKEPHVNLNCYLKKK